MRQSHRLLINASTYVGARAARVMVGFVLPPFVIGQLGREQFGLAVMVMSVLAFVRRMELGTPQALTRFVATEITMSDNDELSRILSTGGAMLCFGALMATVFIAIVIAQPLWFLTIPEGLTVQTARIITVMMGIVVALGMPMSLGGVIFYAEEKFIITNGIRTGALLLRVVLVFTLLYFFEGSVVAYMGAVSIPILLSSVIIFVFGTRILDGVKLSWRNVKRETFNRIAGYGVEIFVNSFALLLYLQASYIIIGKFLGTSDVTMFRLAVTWSAVAQGFITPAVSVVAPAAVKKEVTGDMWSLRMMLVRVTKYGLLVSVPFMIFLVIFRQRIFLAWMGPGYEISANLMIPLLVGFTFIGAAVGGQRMFFGFGKIRFFTLNNFFFGLVNIALALFFVKVCGWGVMGVAVAFMLAAFPRFAVIFPVYMSRTLGMNVLSYFRESFLPPLCAGGITAFIAYGVYLTAPSGGWGGLILSAGLIIAAYLPIVYFLAMDPYDRKVLHEMITRAAGRLNRVSTQDSEK